MIRAAHQVKSRWTSDNRAADVLAERLYGVGDSGGAVQLAT